MTRGLDLPAQTCMCRVDLPLALWCRKPAVKRVRELSQACQSFGMRGRCVPTSGMTHVGWQFGLTGDRSSRYGPPGTSSALTALR